MERPKLRQAKAAHKEVEAALERLRACEEDRLLADDLARVLTWSAVHDARRDDATTAAAVAQLRGPKQEKGVARLADARAAHDAFVAESQAEVRRV